MTLLTRLRSRLDRMLLDSYDLGVDDRGNTVMHVRIWASFPDAQRLTFRLPDPPVPDVVPPPTGPQTLVGPARHS